MAGRSWGAVAGFTPPAAADFSALNSATLSDVVTKFGNGVQVHGTKAGGTATANWLGGIKSMNYVSGTIELVAALLINQYSQDYNFSGIFFREAATGKLTTLTITAQTGNVFKVNLSKWPSATGGGAGDYFDQKYMPGNLIFFKLTYDGTDMRFYMSVDGVTWLQVHTAVAKADYFTTAPDQWGFAINMQNAIVDGDLTCIHMV